MNMKKLVTIAALAVGSVVAAHATPIDGSINVVGGSFLAGSHLNFANPAQALHGLETGDFLPFDGSTSVIMSGIDYTNFSATQQLFTDTVGGETVTFDITSLSQNGCGEHFGCGSDLVGTGMFYLTGFDPTAATFGLTNQGSGTSFSSTAVAVPTPEPASLALFGTGLLGVVGIARRKFNV